MGRNGRIERKLPAIAEPLKTTAGEQATESQTQTLVAYPQGSPQIVAAHGSNLAEGAQDLVVEPIGVAITAALHAGVLRDLEVHLVRVSVARTKVMGSGAAAARCSMVRVSSFRWRRR